MCKREGEDQNEGCKGERTNEECMEGRCVRKREEDDENEGCEREGEGYEI